MVPLPLFKLGALLLRHVSKYGANQIKYQAHDHPKFRRIAERYGQHIHQLIMRVSVAQLRDVAAEKRRKEKAEAPTVKTAEEVKAEEEKKKKEAEKAAAAAAADPNSPAPTKPPKRVTNEEGKSIWSRRFRPLPENKAVDLFAEVVGDAFILSIAAALITYEYIKAKQKPDQNAEKLAELEDKLNQELDRVKQLEESERKQRERVEILEKSLDFLKAETTPQRIKRALSML